MSLGQTHYEVDIEDADNARGSSTCSGQNQLDCTDADAENDEDPR